MNGKYFTTNFGPSLKTILTHSIWDKRYVIYLISAQNILGLKILKHAKRILQAMQYSKIVSNPISKIYPFDYKQMQDVYPNCIPQYLRDSSFTLYNLYLEGSNKQVNL